MTDHGLNNPQGEAGARERSLSGAPQGSPTEKGPGDEPNKNKGKKRLGQTEKAVWTLREL